MTEPQLTPELEVLRDKMMQEIKAKNLNIVPSRDDIALGRNPLGPRISLALWMRFSLLEWPSHLIESLKRAGWYVWNIGVTTSVGLFGLLMSLLGIFTRPVIQLAAALFGHLTVRYSERSIQDAYDRMIRELPSYREFERAGGVFNARGVHISQEYIDAVNDAMEKKIDEQIR